MSLTGSQREELSEAILAAFTTQHLRRMLSYRLDKNLDHFVSGGPFPDQVFELIEAAEREGWTLQLIVAARQFNPGNRQLQLVADDLGVSATPTMAVPDAAPRRVEYRSFERAVTDNSFLDVVHWRTLQAEMESRVCQIMFRTNTGRVFGTGFLLGPDVLITNYHVMEPVIEGEQGRTTPRGTRAKAKDVTLRFDFKRLADGTSVNQGVVQGLIDGDWLIALSRPSAMDSMPEPKPGLPHPDELDFALLRVAGSPGNAKLAGPGGPVRGWIEVPQAPHDFASSQALFIMQHPKETPLQLVLDTEADVKVNANGTRVTYRTNTLGGSSGSPCFSMNWDLIALHHMGDPDLSLTHEAQYNQGIPFSAILQFLEARQLSGVLGAG